MMPFERLVAIRLVSHDAAALADFYVRALGFARGGTEPIRGEEMALLGLAGTGWRTALTLAGQVLQIDQFDPPGQAYPVARAANDPCFQHLALITHDMPQAWARVTAAGGQPISPGGPIQLPPSNASVVAVKFRDPDGHPLELLCFPQPEASAHRRAIDHSAIVVRDVAASLQFYAALGFTEGDRTRNHGLPQAGLDGLAGADVDVIALNPRGRGAHCELLAYRDPPPRRPQPWQVRDVAATRLVWQAAASALIADPDGHLHQCQPPHPRRGSPVAQG